MEPAVRLARALLAVRLTAYHGTARGADLPTPVRAIIGAAMATSYEGKVRTMVELARPSIPSDTDEIDNFRATGNSPNTRITSGLTIARQGIN